MKDKVIGAMLIILGFLLIIWGYDAFNSPETQATRALGGSVPLQVWVGLLGGAINIFVGMKKL